jgi:F-type H+-transporting ATPase subunit a
VTTASAPAPARGGGGISTLAKVLIGAGIALLIAILLGVLLGSEGKNEEFQPQNEFKLDNWIPIKVAGIDLSINKAVLYLFLAAGLTVWTMTYIAKRMQQHPNRVQSTPSTCSGSSCRRSRSTRPPPTCR